MHTVENCTFNEMVAAIRTLERKGYTYQGGELWKPPLGKQPSFVMLDYWQARAEKAEHLLLDAQNRIAELMQHEKRKGSNMNIYEKHNLLVEQAHEMEWLLGAYLSMDSCEKTDAYAQKLIQAIKAKRQDIAALCDAPVSE